MIAKNPSFHSGDDRKPSDGENLRRFFRTRDGKRLIDAWDYGYRCWPIGKSQGGKGKQKPK